MIPPLYRLKQLPVTQSTNDDAKRAAMDGEPEGLVIQALRQTGGKGRQGRTWNSPEGNLYISLLLRPNCPPQEAGLYSFVVALAVYDTARAFLPSADIALKWPNDVLVSGKKISGILLEAAPTENGMVDWLVIGIGVNVHHAPENALYPATSLAEEGAAGDPGTPSSFPRKPESSGPRLRAKRVKNVENLTCSLSLALDSRFRGNDTSLVQEVLTRVLERFDDWRQMFLNKGFAPVRAAWLERAKKGPITARLPHETVHGEFENLDDIGRLILRLQDGSEKAIAAGDVFFGYAQPFNP